MCRYLGTGVSGLVAILLLSWSPVVLTAQTIEGRLLDAGTGAPVAGAALTLLDSRGNAARTALSGLEGVFSVTAPAPGRYRLRAQRIGYGETTSSPLDVRAGEVVEVELRLSTEAVTLAPLHVVSDRPALVLDARLERWGYYERRELLGTKSGWGHFLDHADIDRRILFRTSQLLEGMPGMRVAAAGGRRVGVTCRQGRRPVFYLDGMRIRPSIPIDEVVSPVNLVAAEIYPGRVGPGRFGPGGCVVLLWTGSPP